MRCFKLPISLLICWMLCSPTAVFGVGTIDRDYGLGDDGAEGASLGNPLGSGNGFGLTFDSMGTLGLGDLQDLSVFGNPIYADVSGRPLFSGGLGASFDGAGDYLRGSNLNLPETSEASVNYDDDPSGTSNPGPLNYVGIVDRYFQAWVNPNSASQATTQSVIMDTNQHGLRIDSGNWSLRYAGSDVDSGVAVAFDSWSHVMVARPFGQEGGGRLYVDGIAIAAGEGGYDGTATEELVVGSDTSRDDNLNFTGGTTEFYHGLMDNLTMVILGDNTDLGGQDYGSFDFAVDNEFAADALSGIDPADVNMDTMVDSGDVTAFVAGWLTENRVNDVLVGDLTTRSSGDLNFDGITDLQDWAILNAASPAVGAGVADALFIPEPSGSAIVICLVFPFVLRRLT